MNLQFVSLLSFRKLLVIVFYICLLFWYSNYIFVSHFSIYLCLLCFLFFLYSPSFLALCVPLCLLSSVLSLNSWTPSSAMYFLLLFLTIVWEFLFASIYYFQFCVTTLRSFLVISVLFAMFYCQNNIHSSLFSSVQSLSCVRLYATPWTAACQASLHSF